MSEAETPQEATGFDALKGIVKQRYELRAKAAAKSPEGGFWKDVDAASKATSKGVTAAGKYALGVDGPSSLAGDTMRALGNAHTIVPRTVARGFDAARRKAKDYDPDEPSAKIMQGIPTP